MYIGPKSRTERPRKIKIVTEVAHVSRDSDTTFKVKRSKVKVTRPLWLAVQVTYMDDTIIYATARSDRCLLIMNIHGARRAGLRRRKACMGWSWAGACGVQGRGHIAQLPAHTTCFYIPAKMGTHRLKARPTGIDALRQYSPLVNFV